MQEMQVVFLYFRFLVARTSLNRDKK